MVCKSPLSGAINARVYRVPAVESTAYLWHTRAKCQPHGYPSQLCGFRRVDDGAVKTCAGRLWIRRTATDNRRGLGGHAWIKKFKSALPVVKRGATERK